MSQEDDENLAIRIKGNVFQELDQSAFLSSSSSPDPSPPTTAGNGSVISLGHQETRSDFASASLISLLNTLSSSLPAAHTPDPTITIQAAAHLTTNHAKWASIPPGPQVTQHTTIRSATSSSTNASTVSITSIPGPARIKAQQAAPFISNLHGIAQQLDLPPSRKDLQPSITAQRGTSANQTVDSAHSPHQRSGKRHSGDLILTVQPENSSAARSVSTPITMLNAMISDMHRSIMTAMCDSGRRLRLYALVEWDLWFWGQGRERESVTGHE
ncbi:hypothetical protein GJ744_005336 [Endocarpon pusillum]|uniref:Uncharacterized protein n=1 Tax=Endocarpon pusillum TaxID=364733 RepID=A0A8H7E7D6_9EURO|nr:hypothetical protein GJ744_005336 [Endocarpon pusillum]